MIYCLLFVPAIQKKVYKALKLELENNGSSSMLLKVYPKPGLSIESMKPQFS